MIGKREKGQELEAWNISDEKFPVKGSHYDKLRFFVGYAILAPSSHNTQPWLFKVSGNTIELYADRTRALPVVDPDDRALTISCGAALFNLLLAIRHFGYNYKLQVLPNTIATSNNKNEEKHNDDLLARIIVENKELELYSSSSQSAADIEDDTHKEESPLFKAITKRSTNRLKFDDREIPTALLSRLQSVVSTVSISTVWQDIVTQPDRKNALVELVAEGDRIQMSNKSFRRELASWMHPNRNHTMDGMPGYAFGFSDAMSYLGPFVLRTFDMGKGQAAKDTELATGSPILTILGTDSDKPIDWLVTGMALSKLLLTAKSENIWCSFLNQPIEIPDLRQRVNSVLERQGNGVTKGFPQLLLRMGYGQEVKPTPRRSVDEVLR